MSTSKVVLVGRSSSHFTRVARVFALELGVPHEFRPVLDLTTLDASAYADNPALKVPVLVDERGSLFGTENICRELARRARAGADVVLRGAVAERVVANVEELTLHAMSSGVTLILAKMTGANAPPKAAPSLQNSLAYLDANLDAARAALPPDRRLSFLEVSVYCLVTHLPWRSVLDVTPYARLRALCDELGARPSARETEYRFDAP